MKSDNGLHFIHLSAQELFHTTAFLSSTLRHTRLLGARSLSTMHTALPQQPPTKEFCQTPFSPKTHQLTLVMEQHLPCCAGAAWVNARVKGSPGPNVFQQSTSHWFASLPLPAQILPGFYLRARACESNGSQNITSPSKEGMILTRGTILPCPKVRQPRDEPGESEIRRTQVSPQDQVGLLPEESEKQR